jgi:[acyl-carrier-protein] S-malonyltransferase
MMDGFVDSPIIKNTFDKASSAIDIDLWSMLKEESVDNINQTINTQPLLLTASYATYLAWLDKSNGTTPDYVAGHSLGEYSALEYMQDSVKPGEGAMAAVLNLDDKVVIETCQEVMASGLGVVEGVNFNSIGQIVIAGNKLAVEKASELLKERGARKVLSLPVSVPSHCALMKPAAEKLAIELQNIEFKLPNIAVVQNVNANVSNDVQVIKELLVKQLYSPVLWTKTIQFLKNQEVSSLVECGPGKVLSGLNKRIHEQATLFNLNSSESLIILTDYLK